MLRKLRDPVLHGERLIGEQPKHGNQKQQVCRRGEHRRGKCVSRPRRRWVLGAPTDVTCRLIGSLHAFHCPVSAPRLESLLSSFDRPIHTVRMPAAARWVTPAARKLQ
jgi:hypothetical protein